MCEWGEIRGGLKAEKELPQCVWCKVSIWVCVCVCVCVRNTDLYKQRDEVDNVHLGMTALLA